MLEIEFPAVSVCVTAERHAVSRYLASRDRSLHNVTQHCRVVDPWVKWLSIFAVNNGFRE